MDRKNLGKLKSEERRGWRSVKTEASVVLIENFRVFLFL
jgi:hypothetical protein